MTAFRNPVVGANLPRPLPCIDIDPTTGERIGDKCKKDWKDYKGTSFNCPRGCSKGAFLYPRKPRSKGKDFHFHQGIDIGIEAGLPILSVTGGRVVVAADEYRNGYSYYGKVIVIQATEVPYYFLYAHCETICVAEGEEVKEGQKIGTVGDTWYNSENPTQRFEGRPHLHFEVLTSLSGSVRREETQLGADKSRCGGVDQPRLDPLYILEKLGPWGMTKVHLPVGGELTRDVANTWHERVESSPTGGFFPLGANNHWHGGIHFPTPQGTEVVAPFDATIVAARLDPDPTHALHPGAGHTNFILLRHELSEHCYALFQGKDPTDIEPEAPPKPKRRAVGSKSHCENQPTDVATVKHVLHDRGYYRPDDPADLDAPTVTKVLTEAIRAFQRDHVSGISPDGIVDVPGKTWSALHDGKPPEEPAITPAVDPPRERPLDPKRVLYSLLMHLQPLPLTDATAKDFPWLAQVKLEPDPSDPAEDEAKRVQVEREEDLAEAKHQLEGSVGAASAGGTAAANDADDVLWVCKRLVRFDYHPGPPSSTCDETLVAAIRDFQNEHHPYFKKERNGDGRVDTDGDTVALLRRTRAELLGGAGRTSTIDPILVHRTTIRDEHGTAKVITGLDVKVRSGEPLWRSGQAAGSSPEGGTALYEQIHWELFSEHPIVAGWEPPLEDHSDDLTADVPERIVEMIEGGAPEIEQDYLFTATEIRTFYSSGRARFLRRTPCRFVSHWGLDVRRAVDRLESMGYDVTGVAELLRPLMWWNQAKSMLPADRFVWHYNPIELLADYAEHLESLRPETRDPATHPTLLVRVTFDDGQPMPGAKVWLYQGIDVVRTAKSGADGIARFPGVAVGGYGVRLDEPPTEIVPAEMVPSETTEVTIITDVAGPPLPRGSIHVIVREHTYTIAGSGVEVWLTHAIAGPVKGDSTRKGKLSFDDIVYGDYLIEAGDADPVPVTLDKKSSKVTVILPPPMGKLLMKLSVDGAPAARRELEVLDKSGVVASRLTDADGVAEFELREGRYKARVGDTTKKVHVEGNTSTAYTMKLDEQELPDEEGGLAVSVVSESDGSAVVTELVWVSGSGVFEADYPNASGVAAFALPPGDYTVEVDGRSLETTVFASTTKWVRLEVNG